MNNLCFCDEHKYFTWEIVALISLENNNIFYSLKANFPPAIDKMNNRYSRDAELFIEGYN